MSNSTHVRIKISSLTVSECASFVLPPAHSGQAVFSPELPVTQSNSNATLFNTGCCLLYNSSDNLRFIVYQNGILF